MVDKPAAEGQPVVDKPAAVDQAPGQEPACMALVQLYRRMPEKDQAQFRRHTGLAPKNLAVIPELSNNRMDWNMLVIRKLRMFKDEYAVFKLFPFADLNEPPAYFMSRRKMYKVDKLLTIYETDVINALGDGWLYWIFFRRVIRYIKSNQPFTAKGLRGGLCSAQAVCKLLDDMLDVLIHLRIHGEQYVASAGLYVLGDKKWFFTPFEDTDYFKGPNISPLVKTTYVDMLAKLQEQRWPLSAARHLAFRGVCKRVPEFCSKMIGYSQKPEYVSRMEACDLNVRWFTALEEELERSKQVMPAIDATKGVSIMCSLPCRDPPEVLTSEDELYAQPEVEPAAA